VTEDLDREERFAVPPAVRAAGLRSGIAVLVGPAERPLAILAVHARRVRGFSGEDRGFVESIAHVLAIALGRRGALDAVRRTEASFRSLVEASPELVVIHRDGQMLYANPALREALGLAGCDVTRRSVLELIHPDDRPVVGERLGASGTLAPREVRLLSRDGRELWTEFVATGIDFDDRPARVAIGRDLTERKQAEAQLARSERLATIGTLAAGVAHELRNPLSFVLSNVAWAAERTAAGEVTRALDDARQGAEQMLEVVRGLRSLSRDAAGRAPVDVRRPLEHAISVARAELRAKARVVRDIAEVPAVQGDETQLGQVFLNLLVNAAQAMPDTRDAPGEVRIRVGMAGARVAVEVADDGRGMSAEVRARIFEPFFTTKAAGEGTGLGLWISRRIVEAHEGDIEVETAPGLGTTFRVLLPAVPQAPVGASSSAG
jgi:two-component system, NtrC family, sensor kinase